MEAVQPTHVNEPNFWSELGKNYGCVQHFSLPKLPLFFYMTTPLILWEKTLHAETQFE